MPNTHVRHFDRDGVDLHATSAGQRLDDSTRLQSSASRVGRLPLRAEPERDDGDVSATNGSDSVDGPVSGGGRGASGGGGADGVPLREARGRGDLERPYFGIDAPEDGYAWWYIDGISDDGKQAISIIVFIGSVFSPWYRWSGRKNPANNCCLNVTTYGRGGRWTMTDRDEDALGLSRDALQIGPRAMVWKGDSLEVQINEVSTPMPSA